MSRSPRYSACRAVVQAAGEAKAQVVRSAGSLSIYEPLHALDLHLHLSTFVFKPGVLLLETAVPGVEARIVLVVALTFSDKTRSVVSAIVAL